MQSVTHRHGIRKTGRSRDYRNRSTRLTIRSLLDWWLFALARGHRLAEGAPAQNRHSQQNQEGGDQRPRTADWHLGGVLANLVEIEIELGGRCGRRRRDAFELDIAAVNRASVEAAESADPARHLEVSPFSPHLEVKTCPLPIGGALQVGR